MPEGTVRDKWTWRIIDVLISAVLGILCWVGVQINGAVRANAQAIQQTCERVTRVESNRFTSKDGLEVWKEITALQAQVVALKERQADLHRP